MTRTNVCIPRPSGSGSPVGSATDVVALRDVRQPHREALPRFVSPMLAISASTPTSQQWAVEVKWDGIRAQAADAGGTVARGSPSSPSYRIGCFVLNIRVNRALYGGP